MPACSLPRLVGADDVIRNAIPLLALIFLLLAFASVAMVGSNADSIWYDEYMSLYFAGWPSQQLELGQSLERLNASHDVESATYYFILALWVQFVGWSVFAARLLSMYFALLAVAWAYRLGRDLHSIGAGLAAAALIGASALNIVYSHELRMYSFWALSTLIILWLYWTIMKSGLDRLRGTIFLLALVSTLYTHPLAIAWIGALGLYHLFRFSPSGAEWRGLLALFAAAAILYLPMGLSSLAFAISEIGSRELTARGTAELMLSLANGLSNGFWPILLLPLLAWRCPRRDPGLRMLWFVSAVSVALMFVANFSTGIVGHVRYLLPAMPLFAVCGGVGLGCLRSYRKAAAVIIGVWCLASLLAGASYKGVFDRSEVSELFHIDFPFEEVTSVIRRDGVNSDAVIFEFPYHSWSLQGVFDYYMHGSGMRTILADTLRAEGEWQLVLESFGRFIDGAKRVYFVLDRTIEATPLVPEYERILAEALQFCARLWDSAQVKIDKYAASDAACQSPG